MTNIISPLNLKYEVLISVKFTGILEIVYMNMVEYNLQCVYKIIFVKS